MAIGPVKPTPKPKLKPKKIITGKAYLTNVSRTTKAKLDLKKAIEGGAKKTAKKLAPNDKRETYDYGLDFSDSRLAGGYGGPRPKLKNYTSPKQKAKRDMIAGNIINDLSKTAMRARMIESNKAKKKAKNK